MRFSILKMCWLRSEFRVQEMISYNTYWTRNTTHPDSQWEYKLLWVVPSHNQNNRIIAFDDNISPLCSFCRIVDRDSASRDSVNHFFLACPVTHNLLFQWTRSLNPPPDINSLDFKKLYWFRSVPLSNDETGTVTLCMDFFQICDLEIEAETTFAERDLCLERNSLSDRIRLCPEPCAEAFIP